MSSKLDRATIINNNFIECVSRQTFPANSSCITVADANLDKAQFIKLFTAQMTSRLLDLHARKLKESNLAYYTIGSSGHEANASIAEAAEPSDIAFLHYRSAAFVIARAEQYQGIDIVDDLLRSFVASSCDPISAGRHKVFGSVAMNIPPQTSTIASHLPKAVGTALSIRRAKELNIERPLKDDGVVICSFGDASINHASALSAFNAAGWITRHRYPLPIVFVCEDNGLGISVSTPKDWVKSRFEGGFIKYIAADGKSLANTYFQAQQAFTYARRKYAPVLLHLKTVRLMGHAGSDVEFHYRNEKDIDADEANDPLLHSARDAVDNGFMNAEEIISLYHSIRENIESKSIKIQAEPKLSTASEVQSSILPKESARSIPVIATQAKRKQIFAQSYRQLDSPRNMCQLINYALTDLMLQYDNIVLFGEDVGKKGGVYRVSADLQKRFGARRVFDTLLDEQTILGHAIGLAHNGFIPIPEIQFLAYYFNAEDQIRGEASTLSYFSNGQYSNPMVIRIAGYAYQRGFGGHFHNDNSIAAIRDVPGVVIATPCNGADAAKMLRTCVRLAYQQRRVVFFIEPIALYMTKDLHEAGDQLWMHQYPEPCETIELDEIGVYGEVTEQVILTYGNGVYISRQAQEQLLTKHQIAVKVIDIRWLAPLPMQAILDQIEGARSVLIVDECRRTGSLSEALIANIVEALPSPPKLSRITARDCFIPLGTAWQYILPSVEEVIAHYVGAGK